MVLQNVCPLDELRIIMLLGDTMMNRACQPWPAAPPCPPPGWETIHFCVQTINFGIHGMN